MRPIRLEIKGLQSFKEKQVIDFEKLTEYGLFGIFGETGSGKSTILDGMILALFNEIPRAFENGSVGNSLNDSSESMEIYYKFALGNDIYEITRSYRRGMAKGKEEIKPRDPILVKNGDVIASKAKEVNAKLEEEFGIGVNDFTRSVVLPQGKFSEFLRLKGIDKMKMLENIFDLEKYGIELQNKTTSERNFWKDEIEKYRNQRIGKGIITLDEIENLESDLLELSKELEQSRIEKENINKRYEEMKELKRLDEEREELNIRKENLLNFSDKIEKLKEKIAKDIEALSFKEELEEIKNEKLNLKTLMKLFQDIENKIIEKNKKNRELKEIIENIEIEKIRNREKRNNIKFDRSELKKINLIYREKLSIDEKQKNLFQLENNLENKRYSLETDIREFEKVQDEIITFKSQLGDIIRPDERELINIKKDIEELENSRRLTLEKLEEKEREDVRYLKIKKEIETSINLLRQVDMSIVELEEKNSRNISSILAGKLIEGKACPVCGSLDHPHPAKIQIDENNDYEKELKELIEKKENLGIKLGEQKGALSILEGNIVELDKFLKNKNIDEISSSIEKKVEIYQNLEKKIELIENSIRDLENLILTREEKMLNIKKNIARLEIEIEKENIKRKEVVEQIDVHKNRIEELDINYMEMEISHIEIQERELEEKGVEIDKLLKAYENLEEELEKIKDKYDFLQEELKSSEKEKLEIGIKIDSSKKIIEERESLIEERLNKSSFQTIEEVYSSLLEEREKENCRDQVEKYTAETLKIETLLEKNIKSISGREFNIDVWEKLEKNHRELEAWINDKLVLKNTKERELKENKEKIKELESILELEKLAEKKYSIAEELLKRIGARKFVKFLAVKKLESIVQNASDRLERITNGRYELTCDKDCNFFVIDAFNNGYKRRCSTLSGGETFIVSLCLALALSNQLQLKGKVQLEFFFLDEGFGTLDSQLLDKVIESLENIRREERLKVGIITHVEELKTRIIRKIEVSSAIPGERGSLIKMI